MRKFINYVALSIMMMLSVCSCTNSAGAVDDRSEEQAMALVDSLMKLEQQKKLVSVEFIKTPLPAFIAPDMEEENNKAGDKLASLLIAKAFSRKSKTDKAEFELEVMRDIVAVMEPYREKVREFENSNRDNYIVGLTKITDTRDTTQVEKRILLFVPENPVRFEKSHKFLKRDMDKLELCMTAAYVNEDNIKRPSEIDYAELKEVKNNPIFQFLLND